MRRREFISLLGGAAAAWPLAARAQHPATPVIGFVSPLGLAQTSPYSAMFRRGLNETGYAEGQNVAIEYRFADGHYDRVPALAAELVGRAVTLIVAASPPAALAAKTATATIPIVFIVGFDPVAAGLVASFNRPGGNATGVSLLTTELGPKRLGLLREILPKLGTIAFVVNANTASTPYQIQEMEAAAQALAQPLLVVSVGTEEEVDKAFAKMAERNIAAVLYGTTLLFQVMTDRLVTLAARYRIPALYEWREFVTAGGLMSYSTDRDEAGREAGIYAGRILKGEKPADLPVVQPSRFEFVINLKTAKALGLELPLHLLQLADEVIE
jgi:putative tryptophan/tyrosine transport system substrate-binding protein